MTTPTPYSLPELPYCESALEPVVSGEIMELHHGTHHANYVKAANDAVAKLDALAADEDPSALLRALAFNLSGHVLHSLFWTSMSPHATQISPALDEAIVVAFGSVSSLRARMTSTLAHLSGSGWAVLAWEPVARRLLVSSVHDHQGEVVQGATPLLVIDGWEHAYYLDYKANRAKWAEQFFDIADWSSASDRLEAAAQLRTTT